jgi:hypothetical protein
LPAFPSIRADRPDCDRPHKADTGLIRPAFLIAAVMQHIAFGDGLARTHNGNPGIGTARTGGRGNTNQHAQNIGHQCLVDLFARAHQMAARYMACFMGDHADHLIGLFQPHDRAGIDKYVLPFGHESVERRIVNDVHPDSGGIETGSGYNGVDVRPDNRLGLGIPDQGNTLGIGWLGQDKAKSGGPDRPPGQARQRKTNGPEGRLRDRGHRNGQCTGGGRPRHLTIQANLGRGCIFRAKARQRRE